MSEAPPSPGAGRSTARQLLSGTFWTTLAQVAPLVVNLGMTPYIIHGLGEDRYGVFLLVNNVALMLSQFDGGLGEASMRFFAVNAGRGDKAASTRVVTTVSMVFLVVVGLALLGGAFLGPRIVEFFRVAPRFVDEATFLLRVLMGIFAVIMIRNLFNSLLIAHGRFMFTSLAILSGYAVYISGMIASVEFGWGLWGVAWTFIAQQVMGTVVSVPAALQHLERRGVGLMGREEGAKFLRYAWKVQITGLIYMAGTQKDQMVAARVLSAQESGPYGQGSNFAGQLRMFPMNALGPIQSMMGRLVGAEGAEAVVDRVDRIQRSWVMAVTGWLAVGLPATYFGVRTWLPDGFAVAAVVAPILFVGGCLALLVSVLNLWCLTLGHPEALLRSSLVGLGVNLVGSVALGLPFGLIGVVAATTAGNLAAALWIIRESRVRVPVRLPSPFRHVAWAWAIPAAAVTVALELLAAGHLPRGAAGLLCCGLLAAPGALLFATGTFGWPTVRAAVAKVARRRG